MTTRTLYRAADSDYLSDVASFAAEETTMTTTTMKTITVPADPDQDDCLAAAADAYVAEHPEVAGWDLHPQWADEDRELVELTVPVE